MSEIAAPMLQELRTFLGASWLYEIEEMPQSHTVADSTHKFLVHLGRSAQFILIVSKLFRRCWCIETSHACAWRRLGYLNVWVTLSAIFPKITWYENRQAGHAHAIADTVVRPTSSGSFTSLCLRRARCARCTQGAEARRYIRHQSLLHAVQIG
jgi:hypothetical protein